MSWCASWCIDARDCKQRILRPTRFLCRACIVHLRMFAILHHYFLHHICACMCRSSQMSEKKSKRVFLRIHKQHNKEWEDLCKIQDPNKEYRYSIGGALKKNRITPEQWKDLWGAYVFEHFESEMDKMEFFREYGLEDGATIHAPNKSAQQSRYRLVKHVVDKMGGTHDLYPVQVHYQEDSTSQSEEHDGEGEAGHDERT